MQMNIKKMWPIAAASLLSVTSFLSADANDGRKMGDSRDGYAYKDRDGRVRDKDCGTCCEVDMTRREPRECCPPCLPCPTGVVNPNSFCSINPNARPRVNCARVFITLEALRWTAYEDGLEFAVENEEVANLASKNVLVSATLANSTRYYDAEQLTPGHESSFGFRLGLGYNSTHDGWDLYGNWTSYKSSPSKHVEAESDTTNSVLFAEWSALNVNGAGGAAGNGPVQLTAEDAKATWKVHLDMVDLELGREFYTSRYLTLRPFIGFRGASIRQNFHVQYRGGSFSSTGTSSGVAQLDDVKMNSNFFGIGLRSGLNSNWRFDQNWSLYGNLAIAILYGHFEIDQSETLSDSAITTSEFGNANILDIDDDYHASRAMTDLALGLRYDTDFDCNDYHLAIWLGWEHHIAFSMNQFIRYTSVPGDVTPNSTTVGTTIPLSYTSLAPESGDLTTQGWTLGFEFDF